MEIIKIVIGVLLYVFYSRNRKNKKWKRDENPYNSIKSEEWYKRHKDK
jgi:hypothetical protein